jgi:hypothetical protein
LGPASALNVTLTVTSDDVEGQYVPPETVHLNIYVPVINPVMFVVGEEGFTIVGLLGPETMVQSPEPLVGGTAFMVTEVNPQTPFGVVPPLAIDGAGSETERVTVEKELQAPFVMVYWKT